ncbi:MAG: hypothetical protein OXG04_26375 [Acidobacteria bacterium]|nr:hypothetical protein [Acidobacteriota bacterium]
MPGIDPPARVLLVEGESDKHVVHHLCRRQDGPMPSFRIQDKGTLGQVLDAIGPELKVSGRRALGILVDANDSLADRWGDLSNRCRAASIDLPRRPIGARDLRVDGALGSTFATWLRSLFK